MNPCPEKVEAITLLAAAALEDFTVAELRRHLDECAACREHLTEMTRLCHVALRGPAEPGAGQLVPLPAGFHHRLRARVQADSAMKAEEELDGRLMSGRGVGIVPHRPNSTGTPWWGEWFAGLLLRLGFAAGFVVLVVLVGLWLRGPSGADPGTRLLDRADVEPFEAPARQPHRRMQAPTPPAPTMMAMSRAWNESAEALDVLLAGHERLLAANDPPMRAIDGALDP